jgi:hypothetical protein
MAASAFFIFATASVSNASFNAVSSSFAFERTRAGRRKSTTTKTRGTDHNEDRRWSKEELTALNAWMK